MAEERRRMRRPRRKRRACVFCVEKRLADYKDLNTLRRLITDRGKIMPRRSSGVCAKHQRKLAMAIKTARQIGLLPYVVD